MKLELENYTLPSYWASYLINGDASGMEDDEQTECDTWLESLGYGWTCSNCSEESEFRHSNDAGTLPGDCLDFTFHREAPPKKGTLARLVFDMLEYSPGPFTVTAYELTHDGLCWSVNTPWKIARETGLHGVIEAVVGRWGVFKANYSSRATVKGLNDIGEGDIFELESDFLPFIRIERSEA